MIATGRSDIVEALLSLEREHKTGALDLRAEGVLTRIFVDGGVPVFAEAGVLGETLGHVLVREQIITSAQFAAVVRKMTDAIVDDDNESLRFGEVLVELGFVTQQDLTNALATQIEKKIIGCIPRGVGDWSFDDSLDVTHVIRHATPIRTLLVDAAKFLPESRVEDVLELAAETFPVLLRGAGKVASDYGLQEHEGSMLAMFDGQHTTKSILDDHANSHALLCALVMGGDVELLAERGLKKPPSVLAPILSSGRHRAVRLTISEAPKAEVEAPEARVPSLRPARNDREATLFSEDEFQSGKRLFAQGLLEQAHVQLELACDRSPLMPLYRLYKEFVWSRFKGSFEDVSATKTLAIKVVKEDAECAFAHYVLGYIALAEGSSDSAKRFFEQAFRLDHELLDAGRQARKLDSHGNRTTPSHGLREVVPMRSAAKSKKKHKTPRSRVQVLLYVLVALSVFTVGYVGSVRAGVWADYQEVH